MSYSNLKDLYIMIVDENRLICILNTRLTELRIGTNRDSMLTKQRIASIKRVLIKSQDMRIALENSYIICLNGVEDGR